MVVATGPVPRYTAAGRRDDALGSIHGSGSGLAAFVLRAMHPAAHGEPAVLPQPLAQRRYHRCNARTCSPTTPGTRRPPTRAPAFSGAPTTPEWARLCTSLG